MERNPTERTEVFFMQKDIDIVQRYYDENGEKEWNRLGGVSFEFAITTAFLDRLVKPGDRLLDLGGGPGRYAIHFARRGVHVTLVDLSEGNVAIARREAAAAGVALTTHVGDARDLSKLRLETFDHVLLMGPLYHLLEESDRVAAVHTALEHLRPGGTLAVSFILLFAGFIYYMENDPEGILTDPLREPYVTRVTDNAAYAGDAFTKAYFIPPADILPFMGRFPLDPVTLFGQESILAPHAGAIACASEAARAEWLRVALRLAERPDYLAYAEHAMYIGTKKEG
jgi:SAM-dependent methyltransferase